MIDVEVSYGATDNCGLANGTLSVSSNEPVNGSDDGNTAPDWQIIDAHPVRLRGNGQAMAGGASTSLLSLPWMAVVRRRAKR